MNASSANITSGTVGTDTITLALVTTGNVVTFNADFANTVNLRVVSMITCGTTFVAGANTGDIIITHNTALRALNVAGTGFITLIGSVTGLDNVWISPDRHDIRWGSNLVALGGGSTPTFGTIGGTGPAAAAQDTWMRILDANGTPFWVPAWK
jgi:hypothetical protein